MSYTFNIHPELEVDQKIKHYNKRVVFQEKLYNALYDSNRRLVKNALSNEYTHVLKYSSIQTNNPFVNTCSTAFAFHLPLKLRVEHFWITFVQAIAMHVDKHPEELRSKFVEFDQKKDLEIDVTNRVMKGMGREEWEEVIEQFISKIDQHTKEGVVQDLSCNFSSTTKDEHIASLVSIMDVVKKYFDYHCFTMCGFPKITLEGTMEDWVKLRCKILRVVNKYCMPNFRQAWLSKLGFVLDKLVDARDESTPTDVVFWDDMIKIGGGNGSGETPWISGWINVFFPYGKNKELVMGKKIKFTNFSTGRSSVNVSLDQTPMNLNSGFCGIQYDEDTHEVTPLVAWFLCTKSPCDYLGTNIGINIPLVLKPNHTKLPNQREDKEELPKLDGIRVWGSTDKK